MAVRACPGEVGVKLYIAGLYVAHCHKGGNLYRSTNDHARAHFDYVTNKLESYHYLHKGHYAERVRKQGDKVFLDSGAFSAFSLGVEVSIEAYAEFVKEWGDIIEMASVLDAIGDPEGTFRNQQRLEQLGVETLPCFHFGEPIALCEYYLTHYPYITIGGMVPIPNNKLEIWLDEIWDTVLTDKDGYARAKVHGFGLTARKLMAKYPWYSVDSSSWVQIAANGSIIIPELPQPIAVSNRHPSIKDFMGHYATLPEPSRAYIDQLLAHYGASAEEMGRDHKPRWAFNAFAFSRLGEALGDDHWRKPFRSKQPGLF